MELSRYCKVYPDEQDSESLVLFSTKTASALTVPPDFIEAVRQGRIGDEERATLGEQGFLVPSADAERLEMLDFIKDLNNLNREFNATVVLDLDCNLACTYCFEGTRKGKLYLSPETADAFVDFIKQRDLSNKEKIRLVFYGGEPLLNVDGIVHISTRIKSFAEKLGMKYIFSLVTNGTLLLPHTVKKLLPLGLKSAKVTLDGPSHIHDAFRPFRSGAASFDTIVKNIRDVCGLIEIQIGGNYIREHYREFPRLIDFFLDIGLTPDKISLIRFDAVMNESAEFAPPDFHDGCITMNEPWISEASLLLREAVLSRGYKAQRIMPSVCMVQHPDNIIMNYDGTLYKCPGLLGRKDLCVGNVKTGLIDYRASHALDSWKNEECLACAYLPLCFGGCKYMKLVRDGHMTGVDCKKQFFDRTLARLIAQDIRYDL